VPGPVEETASNVIGKRIHARDGVGEKPGGRKARWERNRVDKRARSLRAGYRAIFSTYDPDSFPPGGVTRFLSPLAGLSTRIPSPLHPVFLPPTPGSFPTYTRIVSHLGVYKSIEDNTLALTFKGVKR
jgi:hypothetical protein